MTAEEENTLRYATWFMLFKLLKRYAQQTGPNPEGEAVAECLSLSQMAVPGKLSSYYDYTKEWLEKLTEVDSSVLTMRRCGSLDS